MSKLYIHMSNGDYNSETDIDKIGWELNEGVQEYVIVTREKLHINDFVKLTKILDRTK